MDQDSPEHSKEDSGVQFVLDPRLAQAQSLRELAYAWYQLSIICKRVGAMIEESAKEILYAPSSNPGQPGANEVNDNG